VQAGPLLEVAGLEVGFGSDTDAVVRGVSFTLARGESLALLGESGCGKTITALSVLRLLPPAARVNAGSIRLHGRELLDLPERDMRAVRGGNIGMVFQEPQTSLNPVMTVGAQIAETLAVHHRLAAATRRRRVVELLELVHLPEPERRADMYPHQLSGGMKQRVMIAIALAGDPELLIADEPTTALDVTIQAQILELLRELQRSTGMALLFITHDLGVAAAIADHVAVMKAGEILETAKRDDFFHAPAHPYSRALFDALPTRLAQQDERRPRTGDTKPLLEVSDLRVWFPIRKGILRRVAGYVKAVDGVSLQVHAGTTLAVVGESGSGKTTLGRGILQLVRPHAGSVRVAGTELVGLGGETMRRRRAQLQVVFQDPYASLNPRMMVGDIIAEGMMVQGIGGNRAERGERVRHLLEQVGLDPDSHRRYPHEFSGGQRQRICIARALAPSPRLIICDEPTSSLDVSVQSQILRLLAELQDRLGLTYVFITHDLGVVAYLADHVAVMYQSRIIEHGPAEHILHRPAHDYTRRLLAAVPTLPGSHPR